MVHDRLRIRSDTIPYEPVVAITADNGEKKLRDYIASSERNLKIKTSTIPFGQRSISELKASKFYSNLWQI